MSSPSDPKQVELLETVRKKRAALEARLRKEPYRVIADRMGVSIGTVTNWVKEMTQTMLPQEQIDELRAQEVAGLDALEERAHTMLAMSMREGTRLEQAEMSTQSVVDQIQRIQEHIVSLKKRRASLLGLDVPIKVKHQVTVRTEFDAEVEELTSLLLNGGNLLSSPEDVDTGAESDV